jgi:hypothetical protein
LCCAFRDFLFGEKGEEKKVPKKKTFFGKSQENFFSHARIHRETRVKDLWNNFGLGRTEIKAKEISSGFLSGGESQRIDRKGYQ